MTYEDARLKEIAECECRYQRRMRRLFGAAMLAGPGRAARTHPRRPARVRFRVGVPSVHRASVLQKCIKKTLLTPLCVLRKDKGVFDLARHLRSGYECGH